MAVAVAMRSAMAVLRRYRKLKRRNTNAIRESQMLVYCPTIDAEHDHQHTTPLGPHLAWPSEWFGRPADKTTGRRSCDLTLSSTSRARSPEWRTSSIGAKSSRIATTSRRIARQNCGRRRRVTAPTGTSGRIGRHARPTVQGCCLDWQRCQPEKPNRSNYGSHHRQSSPGHGRVYRP